MQIDRARNIRDTLINRYVNRADLPDIATCCERTCGTSLARERRTISLTSNAGLSVNLTEETLVYMCDKITEIFLIYQ